MPSETEAEYQQCLRIVKCVGTSFIATRDFITDAILREDLDESEFVATSDSLKITFKRAGCSCKETLSLSWPQETLRYTRAPATAPCPEGLKPCFKPNASWPLGEWPLVLIWLCRRDLLASIDEK